MAKIWSTPEGDLKTLNYSLNEWNKKSSWLSARKNILRDTRTVVQAGGNIGVFPYYLSKWFDTVITYEPISKNYKVLCENTKQCNNIITVQAALGDKVSAAKVLKEDRYNSGAIQLEYTQEISSIRVLRLDDEYIVKDLDLLWLDIEGFEFKAIKGSLNLIEKYRPIIITENNGLIHEYPASLEGSPDFRKYIESLGYTHIQRIMRDDVFIPA